MSRRDKPKFTAPAPGAKRAEAVVPEGLSGERLDKALAACMPDISRTLARKLIGMGSVYIGLDRCRVASRKVYPGDHLSATWHPKVLTPRSFPLRVLHEDARLVAVLKPSGQLVQGTELGDEGTLVRDLEKAYGPDIRLLHRIDAGASGVLLAARDKEAVADVSKQFRSHDLERSYQAITTGIPPEGVCESPLRRDGRIMTIAQEDDDALSARTKFSLLAQQTSRSLVAANLYTGRTHQVRVHLAHLGAPIVGDTLYGGVKAKRLCLHAERIVVKHPDGGRPLAISSPPGADFWQAGQWPDPDVSQAPETSDTPTD